jgi:hypothetical protein
MFILLIILTVALLFLGVVPIGVLITSLLIRQCSDCSMHSLIDLTVFCIFWAGVVHGVVLSSSNRAI